MKHSPEVTDASRSRATILLVEPDRASREMYARALSRLWAVIEAANAEDASRQFAAHAPLAVVIEPYGNLGKAWELLRSALSSPDKCVTVVICSVLDERRTAYALGAAAYLLKPVSPQQLVLELQHLLDSPPDLLGKD